MVQAVIAHAEDLLSCPQPQPTKNRSVPRGSCSYGLASMPWWSGKIKPASWDGWDRIWITNGGSNTVTRFPASDPGKAEQIKVGYGPRASPSTASATPGSPTPSAIPARVQRPARLLQRPAIRFHRPAATSADCKSSRMLPSIPLATCGLRTIGIGRTKASRKCRSRRYPPASAATAQSSSSAKPVRTPLIGPSRAP